MSFSVKSLLPRTLFGRSLLIMVTPVVLLQVIVAYVFFDRHWSKMTERMTYAVAGEIAVVAERIEINPDPGMIVQMSQALWRNLDLQVIYRVDAVLPGDGAEKRSVSVVMRTFNDALEHQLKRPFALSMDFAKRAVKVSVQLPGGVLDVDVAYRRLFLSTSYIFLLWMIFSSIILLVIAILFMRNQIRPIRRLAIAAERIGKGRDLPASFRPEGAREVRQASQAFIEMYDRIRRQLAQRTAMLAGVSHDLRTPLTRLKLQVSMLGNTPDAEAMKADIQDMERMLNAYLDFVRGEGGEVAVHCSMNDMIVRIVQAGRRAGADIHFDPPGAEITLSVRPTAMTRCLNNIIGNALKYAPAVWVVLEQCEDGGVRITVDDNGAGIPADQREDVFRPFVRVEKSRNAATGGVGLGLTIAQDIIHGHGGQIVLEDSPHGGLRVTITLPG